MSASVLISLIASLGVIALATTLVLPGRQTAQVASSALNGTAGLYKAVIAG